MGQFLNAYFEQNMSWNFVFSSFFVEAGELLQAELQGLL
jgi:hypothetical protein